MRSLALLAIIVGTAADATPSSMIDCNGCDGLGLPASAHRAGPLLPTKRHALSSERYADVFRSDTEDLAGSHIRAKRIGTEPLGFSITSVRRYTERRQRGWTLQPTRDHVSGGAVAARYGLQLSDTDIITLGTSFSLEKRRFDNGLSNGHALKNEMVGVEAAWLHGAHWRAALGYRGTQAPARATGLSRSILLAQGAPSSERGPWLGLSWSKGTVGSDSRFSLGAQLQSMKLAERDRVAFGGGSGQDARALISATLRFF